MNNYQKYHINFQKLFMFESTSRKAGYHIIPGNVTFACYINIMQIYIFKKEEYSQQQKYADKSDNRERL